MFKLVVYSLGSLVLVTLVAIFNLDVVEPPETDQANWHAYLTEDELQHPLAKYWYRRAAPDAHVLSALNNGPLPEGDVLSWEDRKQLVEPGYLDGENGWARFDDGSASVAVKTFFPGATAEMID